MYNDELDRRRRRVVPGNGDGAGKGMVAEFAIVESSIEVSAVFAEKGVIGYWGGTREPEAGGLLRVAGCWLTDADRWLTVSGCW